jgi:hypothetical protein
MYSVAAPIWNQIAKTQELQTKWAKKMFQLDDETMTEALNQQGDQLTAQGVSDPVALALLTVGPLLWENVAISQYLVSSNRMDLRTALPEVCSINEAVILASMDRPLTPFQQKQLAKLLESPLPILKLKEISN